MIDGVLQPITLEVIRQWLQLKRWDDDSEFVDDLIYFIPQMDMVWREIKQKEINTKRAREKTAAKTKRRLTNKGGSDGD